MTTNNPFFNEKTKLSARPLGNMDTERNENEWIIFDEKNPSTWFLKGVNKNFAKELVKRWNFCGIIVAGVEELHEDIEEIFGTEVIEDIKENK